jgi:hypothetical protein
LLFAYEVPFGLLFAAPFLRWGLTRRSLRAALPHLGLLLAMLVGVTLLRLALEDDRVAGLTLASAGSTVLRQMLAGPWVSLGSFVLRPLQFLSLVSVDGVVVAAVALVVVLGLFIAARRLRWDGTVPSLPDRPLPGDLLRSLALGGLLLLLAYPLTFTTRPTAISGRETRVHLAAGVGASIVVGGATGAVLGGLRRGRAGDLATAGAAAAFALLGGFGWIVQQDYADAWRLQREFWRALLPQIQDAGEAVVILVDPSGLEDPLQIGANTWNLPRVLRQVYLLPPEWATPPRVYRGVPDWREYLILPDGRLRINGDTTMAPVGEYTTSDWPHLIVVHTDDGVVRRTRPLVVDAVEYPLPEPGPPVLAGLPLDLLGRLLLGSG